MIQLMVKRLNLKEMYWQYLLVNIHKLIPFLLKYERGVGNYVIRISTGMHRDGTIIKT